MTLYEKILFLRKREGLSQEELAEKLAISRQGVYKWESGESQPSLDKIKVLAALFHVSFDFLLDDALDISALDPTAGAPSETKVGRRPVFYTGNPLLASQTDEDCGYCEKSGWIKDRDISNSCLIEAMEDAKLEMEALAITDPFLVHPFGATFLFYNSVDKTFGFFYGGRFQFVCPIENLVGFTFGGGEQRTIGVTPTFGGVNFGGGGFLASVPGTMADVNPNAWATLSYYDGDEIKDFEMQFTVKRQNDADVADSVEELMLLWSNNVQMLLKNLKKLQMKLEGLCNQAKRLNQTEKALPDPDYTPYVNHNQAKNEEDAYYAEAREQAGENEQEGENASGAIKFFAWAFLVTMIVILAALLIDSLA